MPNDEARRIVERVTGNAIQDFFAAGVNDAATRAYAALAPLEDLLRTAIAWHDAPLELSTEEYGALEIALESAIRRARGTP